MKAKTVWVKWTYSSPVYPRHFITHSDKVWFELDADVRWVNVYGKELYSVLLRELGKIIGDE